MQVQRISKGIAPIILDPEAGWWWVVIAMPWPIYPLEEASVPIGQEAGLAPGPLDGCTEDENFCCHRGSNLEPSSL